ncbi:MAG TPA: hypothetical protein VHL31_11035, partial [Geminicoccus sp.]
MLTAIMLIAMGSAHAGTAPDPTRRGPYVVGEGSYALPAKLDRELSDELKTDLAAAVWYPKNAPVSVPRPLLVFLHGNHSTCGRYDRTRKIRVDDDTSYTYDGRCPKGYVQAPSHLGYRYLAQRLAEWGYVVVSINANRGVNAAPDSFDDPGLILRRGRLILRHLEKLGQWSRAGGAPSTIGFNLRGQLDFANIGMLGHSRGGDGIVAAVELLRDKTEPWARRLPTNTLVRGLFAIAPTDFQENQPRPLNLAYTVLLPLCDGDVSDLEGLRFFERAMQSDRETTKAFKAAFTVWGANHNFYNTEWQESDSSGCVGHAPLFGQTVGSAKQRETAVAPVMGFFRATVGRNANPVFARLLDSTHQPAEPFRNLTRYTQAWSSSPDASVSKVLERFQATSLRSKVGVAHKLTRMQAKPVTIPDHEISGLALSWRNATPAKPSRAVVTFAKAGQSVNARIYSSLEVRMSVGCGGELAYPDCYENPPIKDNVELDGEIRLIDIGGRRSTPVSVAGYGSVYAPGGVDFEGYYFVRHPVLDGLRIPTSIFRGVDLERVRSIEFSFGKQSRGVAYVADLRLSRAPAAYPPGTTSIAAAAAPSLRMAAQAQTLQQAAMPDEENEITFQRSIGSDRDGRQVALIDIVASSPRAFPVTGNGLTLRIGEVEVQGGSFVGPGRTDQVLFRIRES